MRAADAAALRLDDVCLDYGAFRALDRLSLHAAEGALVVLLGANGAGKSSIFRAISGLHRLASGRVSLGGRDLAGVSPAGVVAAGLVHCPEGRMLFPALSVEKNVRLGAYVHRRDAAGIRRGLDEVMAMFPVLAEKRRQPAGSLSGGQQQMVAIGRALMGRPKVLLLDEPSLGLAPLVVRGMFDAVRAINRSGTTVLLAEQNAFAALAIASHAYVVEGGRIVLDGPPDALRGDARVRRAYLGG
jgi:branched-chain amino acid transport system ATP-binding protein